VKDEKKSDYDRRGFVLAIDFARKPEPEHPDRVYIWEQFPHAYLELPPEEAHER